MNLGLDLSLRQFAGGADRSARRPIYFVDFTNDIGTSDWSLSRATTASYLDADGTIKTAAQNALRYDWSTGKRALLLENAATNLLSQASIRLANGWVQNGSDAADLSLNELGLFNGVLVASKGAIWHRLACPNKPTVTSGATYHISTFFKFGTSGKIMISLRNNAQEIENRFEVTGSTVSLLSGAFTNITVKQIGTAGVYRLDCDFVPTYSGSVNVGIGPSGATAGENITLLGAQFETGAVRSSFINSAGSPTTRASDITNPIDLKDFDLSGGYTAVVKGRLEGVASEWDPLIQFDNAGNGNRQLVNYNFATSKFMAQAWANSTLSAMSEISSALPVDIRCALSVGPNSFDYAQNGAAAAHLDAAEYVVPNWMRLGRYVSGAIAPARLMVNSIAIYSTVMTQAQLESITK